MPDRDQNDPSVEQFLQCMIAALFAGGQLHLHGGRREPEHIVFSQDAWPASGMFPAVGIASSSRQVFIETLQDAQHYLGQNRLFQASAGRPLRFSWPTLCLDSSKNQKT